MKSKPISRSNGIHQIIAVRLFFLPVQTRMPLHFAHETLTSITCARVALKVADTQGREAEGWGETPLSVQWSWPGEMSYELRHNAMKAFCARLASAWMNAPTGGHALEMGHRFHEELLPRLLAEFNGLNPALPMPLLSALICSSAFDIALHDAFGKLVDRPIYETYSSEFLTNDISHFLEPAYNSGVSFAGLYPCDFLEKHPRQTLPAWHLVAGLDLLEAQELTGTEPKDGFPVTLTEWIRRDELKCLKIKLRGNDSEWDYQRLKNVGQLALSVNVQWLSADFNCTVKNPAYVNDVLDRLSCEFPRIYDMLLYIEQPFPYELEEHRIDVHSVSRRKPLFLDESAHDWRLIRLGRELGWTGVALKTCKTQTGAILSACWAKAHKLSLMVQDLTNPMLAQIPHALLAAHVGTIMGVESNATQFYPAASAPEEAVHPGLYQRKHGVLDLSSISGPGFGYRLNECKRTLPTPAVALSVR
jgi:L-alanine-DL-glutamate epimerase-like enolase superfamily enzyme